MGFHYKCPLCGEISWYDLPLDSFSNAIKNPNELIVGRCNKCERQWVKYARVVFGGEAEK